MPSTVRSDQLDRTLVAVPADLPAAARARRREPGAGTGQHDGAWWGVDGIAARIRQLVARHDRGDVCAAARRLGVPVQHLVRLDRFLADGHEDPEHGAAVERLLTGVVLRYGVRATWLLTGSDHPVVRDLPPTLRIWLADCLLAVGRRIVEEYRAHGAAAAAPVTTPAADGAA